MNTPRPSSRAAGLLTAFVLATAALAAQPAAEPYVSPEGRFAVRFPGAPKVVPQTTKSVIGDLKVTVATYATADANVYMVSFTDFPVAATKAENHKSLFDGVREAVKGKGEVVTEKDLEFGPDKLPGREVIVDRDKGKQRIKFRAVLRDNRLYQVAIIGTADFVSSKDATAFFESLDLTK